MRAALAKRRPEPQADLFADETARLGASSSRPDVATRQTAGARVALVSAEEEHIFRSWRADLGSLEKLAAAHGKTEAQMIGVVAGIWRRLA